MTGMVYCWYAGIKLIFWKPINIGLNGGGEEIRTLDPNVANVVLSQLSYAPTRRLAARFPQKK